MLVIRLSRHGRKNLAVYRVVLSEHTKPVKYGYKEVLGSYDPVKHTLQVDVDTILARIKKGAQPSERVAKLLLKETKNDFFNKFIEHRERKGITKKEEKK
ncbi:MAG: 30S ribosomal protein S16 [Candidatus Absconditabacterales bacterium]